MTNPNIPAGPWSLDPGRGSIVTPNGAFALVSDHLARGAWAIDRNAKDNIARVVAELPAILTALEALYARADAGLDQSVTHDGLRNCEALAKARAALNNVNRSN